MLRCFSAAFMSFDVTLADRWREAKVEVYSLDAGLMMGIDMGPETDRGVEVPEALLDDLL